MARQSVQRRSEASSRRARRIMRASVKVRVASARAHVQAQPAETRAFSPQRSILSPGHHHPLFVLAMVRRRRARGQQSRGVPRPLAFLIGLFGLYWVMSVGFLLLVGAATWGAYEYFAKDLPSI